MSDIEGVYTKLYADIRANPDAAKKAAHPNPKHDRDGHFIVTSTGKYPRNHRLTNEDRKERVRQKITSALTAD